MTIQVEISPEAEAQLAAGARGIPVAKYAGTLLQEALAPSRGGAGMLTLENVDAFSKKLSEGSESMSILSLEANERASYYEDRW